MYRYCNFWNIREIYYIMKTKSQSVSKKLKIQRKGSKDIYQTNYSNFHQQQERSKNKESKINYPIPSVHDVRQQKRQVSIKLHQVEKRTFSKTMTPINVHNRGMEQNFLKVKPETEAQGLYKFSETVINTSDNKKQRAIWISKRGSINFHLMENQDHIIAYEKNKLFRVYGILDGNGQYGKTIAEYLGNRILEQIVNKGTEVFFHKKDAKFKELNKTTINQNLVKSYDKKNNLDLQDAINQMEISNTQTVIQQSAKSQLVQQQQQQQQNQLKTNEYKNAIIKIIEDQNKRMNKLMKKQVKNSGCTLLMVIILDQYFYCFNVGTSKAILTRTIPNNGKNLVQNRKIRKQSSPLMDTLSVGTKKNYKTKLSCVPISTQQTLSRFDQKARILSTTKAILQKSKDQNGNRVGPLRIWKKGEKYPGISITRCLGMSLATEQELGIISTPECLALKIKNNFKFILLGSDGFWKVFSSNQQILKIIEEYWRKKQIHKVLTTLINQAVIRWNRKSELMDDISLMIIKL